MLSLIGGFGLTSELSSFRKGGNPVEDVVEEVVIDLAVVDGLVVVEVDVTLVVDGGLAGVVAVTFSFEATLEVSSSFFVTAT